MTTVINKYAGVPYDIYIGRPSKWGNPFVIGRDGTRDEVIEKYRNWIKTQPELLKDIPSLRGKILACYCKPNTCHGDVLAELADKDENRTEVPDKNR